MLANKKNIQLYRGDDCVLLFPHEWDSGDITEVRFYVRDEPDGTLYLRLRLSVEATQFDVQDDYLEITVLDTDTSPLGEDRYRYDVEVTVGGLKYTIQYGEADVIGDISTDVVGDSVPTYQYYLDEDEHDAVSGANSPSGTNVFATIDDVEAEDELSELNDTDISSPAADDLLRYVGGKWVNEAQGVADGDVLRVDGTLVDNDLAYATASGIEGKTVTEFVALLRSAGLIGIGNNDILEVDDADAVVNDFARFTASGLQGRSYVETVALLDGAAEWDFDDHDLHNMKQVDFYDTHNNGDSGTTETIDWNECNIQKVRLTGNVTFTFTAPAGPCGLTLYLIGDGTVRTTTFPATAEFLDDSEPVAWGSTNNEVVGIISLRYDSSMTPNYIMTGKERT